MLIDEVKIKIKAGSGGKGAVAFDKNLMALGPTGGGGGKGGDVYFQSVSDISALNKFQNRKEFKAEDGKDGRPQFRDGSSGNDLFLEVPYGTVVTDLENGQKIELTKRNQKIIVLKGGKGGKGNFHFKSSRNTSPEEFQFGKPGEESSFLLELKLIADIGLVGLPNVGKSSFLNQITGSNSKVANYHFTTLEPHLGVYYELVIADIPGIISGASEGKGLGFKFLKHISRTKILFHFIASDSEDPISDYKTIRNELSAYDNQLTKKEEYIFITKSDIISSQKIEEIITKLKGFNKNIFPISIIDDQSIALIKEILNKIKKDL